MSDLTPERLAHLRRLADVARGRSVDSDAVALFSTAVSPNVVTALLDEIERLRQIVEDMTDPDDCWYDHHGYCQAHGWLQRAGEYGPTGEPHRDCPHARARRITDA